MITVIILLLTAAGVIWTVVRRHYAEAFCFLYIALPDYLAIEFSGWLPLLTAARVLLLLLFILVFVKALKDRSFRLVCGKNWLFVLGAYYVLRLIPNIAHITETAGSFNVILKLTVEQVLLLAVLCSLFSKTDRIQGAIKAIVYGSGIVSLLMGVEFYTGFRLADYLYTADRYLLNVHYIRLGYLRSVAGFGLPGFAAMFLLCVLPFVFYLSATTGKKRFAAIALLDTLAMVYTGCRSAIAAFGVVIILWFLLIDRESKKSFLIRFAVCAAVFLLFVGVSSLGSRYLRYYYSGTAKSVLNEVGFDFDLSEGAPEGVDGYGSNEESGTYSRTSQYSGIEYTLRTSPIVGLGASAHTRGLMQYYWKGKWRVFRTYDAGYVEFMGDEGLIGTAGQLILLVFAMLEAVRLLRSSAISPGSMIMSEEESEKEQKRRRALGAAFTVSVFTYILTLAFTAPMYHLFFIILSLLASERCRTKDVRILKKHV